MNPKTQYGLQMKYPYNQPIPKAHQLPVWSLY